MCLLHEVHYAELTFEPREELNVDPDIAARLKALCITAGRGSDSAWASYAYAPDCGGAPDRTGTCKTLVAPAGRWVQMAANGRFPAAWDGPWTYEKHVVNVGLFAEFVLDCFVASDAAADFASLGSLW